MSTSRRRRTGLAAWRSYWPGAEEEDEDEPVDEVADLGEEAAAVATPALGAGDAGPRPPRRSFQVLATPFRAVAGALQASWPGQAVDSEEDDALLIVARHDHAGPSEPALGADKGPTELTVTAAAEGGIEAGTATESDGPLTTVTAVADDGTGADERAPRVVALATADGPDEVEGAAEAPRRRWRWLTLPVRLPLAGARRLGNVAHAVYSALADPIANADEKARERQAARARRAGLVTASAALALVLIYTIFPVREYLDQRAATDRLNERHERFVEANEQQRELNEWLRSEEGTESLARELGYSYEDEESYTVFPNESEPDE